MTNRCRYLAPLATAAEDTMFSDTVKCGTLFIKNPPAILVSSFTLRPWKKRYVVLSDTWCTSQNTTSLNIYLREPVTMTTSIRHYAIDLRHVTNVGQHVGSRRFHFSFHVHRLGGKTLLFGVDSEIELNAWIAAIKTLANKVQSSTPLLRGVAPDNGLTGPAEDMSTSQERRMLTSARLTDRHSRASRYGPEIGGHLNEVSQVEELNDSPTNSTARTTSIFSFLLRADPGLRRGKLRNRGNQDSGYSESFDSETGSVQYLKLVTGTQLDQLDLVHSTTPLTACIELHDLTPSLQIAFVSSEDIQHSFPRSFSSVTYSTEVSKLPPTPPLRPRPHSNLGISTNRRPVSQRSEFRQTVDHGSVGCDRFPTMEVVGTTAATSGVDDCPPKPPPRPPNTLRHTYHVYK